MMREDLTIVAVSENVSSIIPLSMTDMVGHNLHDLVETEYSAKLREKLSRDKSGISPKGTSRGRYPKKGKDCFFHVSFRMNLPIRTVTIKGNFFQIRKGWWAASWHFCNSRFQFQSQRCWTNHTETTFLPGSSEFSHIGAFRKCPLWKQWRISTWQDIYQMVE